MMPKTDVLKFLPAFLLCMIPVTAFADTSGSIAVTLTYTNGDTADYWPVSLVIYQDTSQTPYKQIESITGNPFNIVSLPTNHQYKIVAYANSMYSSVTYVDLEQSHQDVTIKLPLPGGMRINAFYNDGTTPISNATVYVRAAQDNKTWGHSTTNADGDSLRFWIEPTTAPDDHYIVDIYIGNHLVYSNSPIYLRPGISQEIKVTTNWPPVVNSLVTAKILNSQSHPVQPSDGKFTVSLYDSNGAKISDSPVTSRGEAYFSNLKVGDYTFKVTRTEDNTEYASSTITENGLITTFQILPNPQTPAINSTVSTGSSTNSSSIISTVIQVPPTPKPPMPTCNCVAFRLDNVQDYWLDNVQTQVIDSFASNGTGITIGVIGKAFGNDSKFVNYLESKTQQGNIDVAINGWSFEDFTTLTKDQQSELLHDAKAKLSSLLGISPSVFIPPYEKTNDDTFYAMSDNSIQIMSSSSPKIPSNFTEKIHNYPATVFPGVLSQNTDQNTLNGKIMSSVQDSIQNNGYAIVTISFQDYAQSNGTVKLNTPDTAKIQNLQSLIDTIENNGYRITTISEMPGLFKIPAPWASDTQQWSQGKIQTPEYLKTVKSMLNDTTDSFTTIPSWVKHNARLQSSGLISDNDFVTAIKYLVDIHAIK